MSFFKKCIPSCGRKKKEDSAANATLRTESQRICFKCQTAQSVATDASVFVCTSCHAVNRLAPMPVEGKLVQTQPEPPALTEEITELVSLRRVNSSTFARLEDAPTASEWISGTPGQINPCSICLDAPGDMIFLPCMHGGFCEACARHIAGNNAVGGAFCVKCRAAIERVVRIVELDKEIVKAVPVEVQTDVGGNKQPPKVPPPRGFNKAKKK